MDNNRLRYLHTQSYKNRINLEKGSYSSCFYCIRCVSLHSIKEWTADDSAICPYCGVDALISSKDLDFCQEDLQKLNDYYFNTFGNTKNTEETLRAYFFGNMYLSSIQQGIQSAHVVAELFNSNRKNSDKGKVLYNWSKNHKTVVLLNGGYSSELKTIYDFFAEHTVDLGLPFAKFCEEEDALNGALTSVGIILPESIYDAKTYPKHIKVYSEEEVEFANITDDPTNIVVLDKQRYTKYLIKDFISQYKLAY